MSKSKEQLIENEKFSLEISIENLTKEQYNRIGLAMTDLMDRKDLNVKMNFQKFDSTEEPEKIGKPKIILDDKALETIFYKSIENTKLQFSSNPNPFEMFKKGFVAAHRVSGIILPSDDTIKSCTPYYGKSCNKHWFEGALWMKDWIKKYLQ